MAPPEDAPAKVPVLGVGISATDYGKACRLLARWGARREGAYVCVCNVHTVMEAHRDPGYAAILNGAAIATPDGMPLVWTLRRLGRPGQTRVYGPDLLLAFAIVIPGRLGIIGTALGTGISRHAIAADALEALGASRAIRGQGI